MDEVQWLAPGEQDTWRAYLDSTRLLIQALDRQLESAADVSFTDYELLVRLSEAPDQRLRMRDLADATLSTRSGVSRAVTRLEQAGWVRRTQCANDKRGLHAELTAAGMAKLAETAPGHVAAVRSLLFDLLTTDQVEQLRAIHTQLRDHLQHHRL